MAFNPLKNTNNSNQSEPDNAEDIILENQVIDSIETDNTVNLQNINSSSSFNFFEGIEDEKIFTNDKKDSNNISQSSNLDFLQPKKNAKKESKNDFDIQNDIENNAYQHTLKVINSIKILSPILSTIILQSNTENNNDKLSSDFKNLVLDISNIAEKTCQKLDIDTTKKNNFWIKNSLEVILSEIIKKQWDTQGHYDISNFIKFIDYTVEHSQNVDFNIFNLSLSTDIYLKTAAIKAMLPIISETNYFDLYRNIESDIEVIMTTLFNSSKDATTKLADDYANENDRAKLFYMIIQEAGILYASCWKSESSRIKQIINQYSEEKLVNIIDKHKNNGGLPLDKVNSNFDKYFNKLIQTSDKLISLNKDK